MAMQAGMGLSKILLLTGAGALLVKHGNLSNLLGELQALVKGLELSRNQSEGDSDYSDAIAAQVRRLAMEVRQLASSSQLTVINSGQSGNLTSMVVPAATVGALGYGYLWWKGIALSDFMYVTKSSMKNAVTSLKQNLVTVTDALAAVRKHLTQRIENIDGKLDDQRELSKEINQNVSTVKVNLNELGYELDALQSLVSGLDGRMSTLEYKQDWVNEGVSYLCGVASGQRLEMPRTIQEQLKISAPTRASLTYMETEGVKGFADDLQKVISSTTSDSTLLQDQKKLNFKPMIAPLPRSLRASLINVLAD